MSNRSMYSNSSEQYWKKRKKETNPFHSRTAVVIVALCITTLLVRTTFTSRSRAENERQQRQEEYERMRVMTRTSSSSSSVSSLSLGLEIGSTTSIIIAKEEQLSLCESNMRDALRLECDDMCNVELSSLPRPTMYRSCHHGCSRSFYSGAVEGCREGGGAGAGSVPSPALPPSPSVSVSSPGNDANSSCSRYVTIEPKPDVQSTCKKYYREGTKRGRTMGLKFINELLDAEWERQRVNLLVEMKKLI